MGDNFMEDFEWGVLLGFGLACSIGLITLILLGANGYTLTRQPPDPVLVPIDCKGVV